MKKTVKIIFAVFMSVLIICFSCVTAFADTSVTDEYNKTLNFFKTYIYNYVSEKETLQFLPDNQYLTLTEVSFDTSSTDKNPCVKTIFIPFSGKKLSYYGDIQSTDELSSVTVPDDVVYLYSYNKCWFGFLFSGNAYVTFKTSSYGSTSLESGTYSYGGFTRFSFGTDKFDCGSNYIFCSDETVIDILHSKGKSGCYSKANMNDAINHYTALVPTTIPNNVCVPYSSLFLLLTNIFPGYSGHIVDTSFEGLLADKGLTCDDTITKNYKFQISYIKNNDLVMMFLNNNKKPDLKIEDYKDGLNTNSKKYTFTYNSVYDTIVYFPQYQKYLKYDDWYNSDSVPKNFRWFWSEDKKSFSLISDWNVSFDETGKASYTGTRVVVNWKLDESSIDNISLSKSWQVDKEMLKDKGWKEGRPSDQNYPYCVQLWQNNIPIYSVYFNSKPKVRIKRDSDYYCEYAIDMVGMCGYVYSEWADMSTQFDFTTGKVSKGSDFLSQGQNLVWYLFNDLGGRVDDSCLLHLYDNYKGNDDYFVGTKVFFNWDVTSNTFDTNLKNQPDFDYTKTLLKGGEYKDKNGHIHGGSLKNYDDDDLNKWNTNGKDDDSNKNNSSDFDFSFEGITEYCKDFWSFMQSSLAIFPSFVWLLVGASIAVLIALRLLGR